MENAEGEERVVNGDGGLDLNIIMSRGARVPSYATVSEHQIADSRPELIPQACISQIYTHVKHTHTRRDISFAVQCGAALRYADAGPRQLT